MSLEVDNRQADKPIPYQREDEGFMYLNEAHTQWNSAPNPHRDPTQEKHLDDQQSKPTSGPSRINAARNSKPFVFWSLLVCLVSVLAIVAAGVAGALAEKRGRSLTSCMSTVQKLDSFNSNSTCPPNLSTTNTTASSSSAQNADPGSFISTSDCSTLSSPYIPTLTSLSLTSSNISFTIKCDTDYSDPDADFMTVAVFTFEDCIAACASFNERAPRFHPSLTCYIASYGLNLREVNGGASPSCRLKAVKNIASSATPGVAYSALLVES